MKKKSSGKGRVIGVVIGVVIVLALAAYYFWMNRTVEPDQKTVQVMIPAPPVSKPEEPSNLEEEKESAVAKRLEEIEQPSDKDRCEEIAQTVQEFFFYLDKKAYIQSFDNEIKTYERFKQILKKLSVRPPEPAGEGLEYSIMDRNIFYFFRTLTRDDIRLILVILSNESGGIEINLDIFFRWLMLGNDCPDPEGVKPSFDVLYKYAGYFLNSIGGRAYLYRRAPGLRLLISYYSLVIVHEANERGKNISGVDIVPLIDPIIKEMNMYQNFHYLDDYTRRLGNISAYYKAKR